jgi:uncharacterized membrane-anchored protein
MATDHPLRLALNDEVHGRPALPMPEPAKISHFAFTETQPGSARQAITDLCRRLGAQEPNPEIGHHTIIAHDLAIKWEQHGEFYTLTIAEAGPADQAFNAPAAANLPTGWLATLPGQRLVALNIGVRKGSGERFNVEKLFGHGDLAGSFVNDGMAMIWMDFRIGADGFSRAFILDKGLGPQRIGRLVRRLVEIETYRMMALLTFPVARALQPKLTRLETMLTSAMGEAPSADGADSTPLSESELLARIQSASREIEETLNVSNFRFAAARAYWTLVNKRIAELGEQRIGSLQPIEVFLDRRLGPAMNTCEAVERRLSALAERSERASNLLRTRVDIALEAQNQSLLRSMEQNARRQLRLQQTVEGLSVVAISYYLVSMLAYVFKGLEEARIWPLHAPVVTAIAAPLVVAAVWLAMRRLRQHLMQ